MNPRKPSEAKPNTEPSKARLVALHPEDLLDRLTKGTLTDEERIRLRAHLAECTVCRAEQVLRTYFAFGSDASSTASILAVLGFDQMHAASKNNPSENTVLAILERDFALEWSREADAAKVIDAALSRALAQAAPAASSAAATVTAGRAPTNEAINSTSHAGAGSVDRDLNKNLRYARGTWLPKLGRTWFVRRAAWAIAACIALGVGGAFAAIPSLRNFVVQRALGQQVEVGSSRGSANQAQPTVRIGASELPSTPALSNEGVTGEVRPQTTLSHVLPMTESSAEPGKTPLKEQKVQSAQDISRRPLANVAVIAVEKRAVSPTTSLGAESNAPLAEALFASATEARRSGRTKDALALYGQISRDHPGTSSARLSLIFSARLARQSGDVGRARRDYTAYLATGDHDFEPEARMGLADAFQAEGQVTAAVTEWERVRRSFPGSPYARLAEKNMAAAGRP
jgi:Tetratricopeptide repeat-like domain/Putative zinc-finger